MVQNSMCARRRWLRALCQFKRGIALRAKLGALQAYCDQVAAQRARGAPWDIPTWEDQKLFTLLYMSIKDGVYPPEVLLAFTKTASVRLWRSAADPPTPEGVVAAVDAVCQRLGRPLRAKFGVLDH